MGLLWALCRKTAFRSYESAGLLAALLVAPLAESGCGTNRSFGGSGGAGGTDQVSDAGPGGTQRDAAGNDGAIGSSRAGTSSSASDGGGAVPTSGVGGAGAGGTDEAAGAGGASGHSVAATGTGGTQGADSDAAVGGDCPALESPTHGSVNSPSVIPGSQASYACLAGYELKGAADRTCGSDGTWSGTAPTCALKDCGPLTAPAEGAVAVPTTTYGATATYSCAQGYGPSGSSTRTCQANGGWSGTAPSCVVANCPALPGPSLGTVDAQTLTYGSVATYACNAGYTLVGVATRTCQSSGDWTGSAPTCEPIDCTTAPTVLHSARSVTTTTYGSGASYTCDSGYSLTGKSPILCQASGAWETAPTCSPKNCGSLAAPSNGKVDLSGGTTFGAQAAYSCSAGYRLSSSTPRTCGADGKWDGTAPTCAPVDCGVLSQPTNGNVVLNGGSSSQTTYGSTAKYSCNTGYALTTPSDTRTCGSDGLWSSPSPVCARRSCASGNPGAGTNCGTGATEDCCASLAVPGGLFYRNGDSNYQSTVSDFVLDKYEITVGRFRAFVNAGMGTQANPPASGAGANPHLAGSGWNSSWNASLAANKETLTAGLQGSYSTWAGGNDNRPINLITWYEAFAFCIWDGGRLPTDLEWNYAASGGGGSSGQRPYPWGTATPTSSYAAYGCLYNASGTCTGVNNIAPVGQFPSGASRWWQMDMAGNVWEWVLDYYGTYPSGACTDCALVTGSGNRTVRGGAYDSVDTDRQVSTLVGWWFDPTSRYSGQGARCVKNP